MEKKDVAATRFGMVKKRHFESLKKAEREGLVDKEMIPLCDYIAETKNYFTSSGCSGRILLLGMTDRTKKNSFFHRKWHGKTKFKDVLEALHEETKGEIWLKAEAFIVHIGTNSLVNARKILALKNKTGMKRGGIIVAKDGKFIVELIGTDEFSLPVKKRGEIIVSVEYLKEIVREANKKIERNYSRVKKFERAAKKELK